MFQLIVSYYILDAFKLQYRYSKANKFPRQTEYIWAQDKLPRGIGTVESLENMILHFSTPFCYSLLHFWNSGKSLGESILNHMILHLNFRGKQDWTCCSVLHCRTWKMLCKIMLCNMLRNAQQYKQLQSHWKAKRYQIAVTFG